MASNEPVCALCGSASRTSSAAGSLPGTGPEFRAIPTCAPLWPTPTVGDSKSARNSTATRHRTPPTGVHAGNTLTNMMTLLERDQCSCRCHTSTSSPADSPARTSVSLAAGPDWPENARVFGGSSQGSLGNYDPATSSLRTSQLSLLEDSTSSLRTLPRAGSMRNGTIYQRQPLAPLTGATASGSLPTPETFGTPTTRDWKDVGDMTNVPTNGLLGRQVLERPWPTPTARLGMARGPQAKRYHDPARSNDLDDAVAASGTPGSLNPTWCSVLMGFPPDWTEVD